MGVTRPTNVKIETEIEESQLQDALATLSTHELLSRVLVQLMIQNAYNAETWGQALTEKDLEDIL